LLLDRLTKETGQARDEVREHLARQPGFEVDRGEDRLTRGPCRGSEPRGPARPGSPSLPLAEHPLLIRSHHYSCRGMTVECAVTSGMSGFGEVSSMLGLHRLGRVVAW
jgi:hypothetical protein